MSEQVPYSWLPNYGYQAPTATGVPDYISQAMGQPVSVNGMTSNSVPMGMGGQGLQVNPMASFGSLGGASNITPNTEGGGFMAGMLGSREAPGWGGMALGGASALMNGFMAMKQYGLAKDTLATNKEQFKLNYDAQKKTTNSALEDRQRARVASNAGAYQSVGSYMSQNGI